MTSLVDITDQLLLRSKEAIGQLEDWLTKQQEVSESKLLNAPKSSDGTELRLFEDKYNLYLRQLNSLLIRSQSLKNKLSHTLHDSEIRPKPRVVHTVRNTSDLSSTHFSRVEELVYEFQDLTFILNELAASRNSHFKSSHESNPEDEIQPLEFTVNNKVDISKSPSSNKTKSSYDSFEPKPFKILERNKQEKRSTNIGALNQRIKSVNFNPIEILDTCEINDYFSMPSSPKKSSALTATDASYKKFVRNVKSYDLGLRGIRKNSNDSIGLKLSKNMNRISLTLSEDITTVESDLEYESDQDTVIWAQSPIVNNSLPLRRCNSHESVLSVRGHQTLGRRNSRMFPRLPNTHLSAQSAQITSSNALFTKPTVTSSREMLSSLIDANRSSSLDGDLSTLRRRNYDTKHSKRTGLSLLSRFNNFFGSSSSHRYPSNTSSSGGPLAPKNCHLTSCAPNDNIQYNKSVSVDELAQALNTELFL